jgi:hypothetical protein
MSVDLLNFRNDLETLATVNHLDTNGPDTNTFIIKLSNFNATSGNLYALNQYVHLYTHLDYPNFSEISIGQGVVTIELRS